MLRLCGCRTEVLSRKKTNLLELMIGIQLNILYGNNDGMALDLPGCVCGKDFAEWEISHRSEACIDY